MAYPDVLEETRDVKRGFVLFEIVLLISFIKIKTMDFSSLIEIINKALTNDEAEQQDEKRNCPNPLSIRSLLIFVLSHITCAIICYQILINIHNLFNVVMDICTGTRRPAADDSLTNESRVDSPKFDYIVSNNNAFTDLAKNRRFFWTNIENNVLSRSYNCKYAVLLIRKSQHMLG